MINILYVNINIYRVFIYMKSVKKSSIVYFEKLFDRFAADGAHLQHLATAETSHTVPAVHYYAVGSTLIAYYAVA
jgi:hypothetical protein